MIDLLERGPGRYAPSSAPELKHLRLGPASFHPSALESSPRPVPLSLPLSPRRLADLQGFALTRGIDLGETAPESVYLALPLAKPDKRK